jgi:hypothetical protein
MLFCNGWVSAFACDARHIVEVQVSYKLTPKFSVMGSGFDKNRSAQ